jgi:hypothetical protein
MCAFQEFRMPQFTMNVAADPKQVADLKRFIDDHAKEANISVAAKPQALDRDASILHIALTALTTQAVGLLFSVIKDYISRQLKKPEKPSFAIQIGDTTVSIKDEKDVAKLDDVKLSSTEDVAD